MQNSQMISILIIFILVFSVTTIALTLEGSHTVFAAKKSTSEEKTTAREGAAPTPSSGAGESNSDDSRGSSTVNPLSIPCPDGSIPVKGKCPLPPTLPSEDSSSRKNKHNSEEK